MSTTKKGYTDQALDETQESKQAQEWLRKMGEITKPYGAECLGSFSIHFFVEPNLLTGRPEVGFVTHATELNMRPEIRGALMESVRDKVVAILGGTIKKPAPKTMKQIELEKEEIRDTMPKDALS